MRQVLLKCSLCNGAHTAEYKGGGSGDSKRWRCPEFGPWDNHTKAKSQERNELRLTFTRPSDLRYHAFLGIKPRAPILHRSAFCPPSSFFLGHLPCLGSWPKWRVIWLPDRRELRGPSSNCRHARARAIRASLGLALRPGSRPLGRRTFWSTRGGGVRYCPSS